ncbi:hypothetical protein D3C87_2196630 [compost metagenome]
MYFLFVSAAMKATKAADPIPELTSSKITTVAKDQICGPVIVSNAKAAVERACKIPKIQSDL